MPASYKIILLLTGFCTSLITGLFYSYSCSVNIGLSRLSDAEYLRSMQSINRAILNPWFFASFIGTLVLLPVCTWICYQNEADSSSFYMLLAAAAIYIIGVFGITIIGNVPLNNMIDKFNINSVMGTESRQQRLAFEKPWNGFHLVRTLASMLSLLLTLGAMIFRR